MRVVLRILGALFLATCACLLLAWTVGRIVSDRWVWSQYLAWMPTILVALLAAALWLLGAGMVRVGRRRDQGTRRTVRRAIAALGLWTLAVAGYLLVLDMRIYRLPLKARPAEPHLRILNWNVTSVDHLEHVTASVQGENPDIAILVNPNMYVPWGQVPGAFGADFTCLNIGGMVVLSRAPVLRYGMVLLNPESPTQAAGDPSVSRSPQGDPGKAMFIELDTTVWLGRTTVAWVVDMPSEPRLSRWKLASRSAERIKAWKGPSIVAGPDGLRAEAAEGFPAPDVVLGDFNIPRGSASLGLLVPGMRNAFDETGTGLGGTWPRTGYRTPIPLLQIDQVFLGAGLRAARYELIDAHHGFHKMQVVDVVPTK